jgi:hypothetical protein
VTGTIGRGGGASFLHATRAIAMAPAMRLTENDLGKLGYLGIIQ